MANRNSSGNLAKALVVCGLALGGQHAAASTAYYFYEGAKYPNYLTGTIRADTNNSYNSAANTGYEKVLNVGAGAFKMARDLDNDLVKDPNESQQSLITWCVDVFHTIQSAKYTDGNLGNLSTYISTKLSNPNFSAGNLQSLVNQRYTGVTQAANNTYSAAFQLALWEIVNETSGTYNLSSGSFEAQGFSASAISLAQTWLALSGPVTGNYNVKYLFDFNGEASPNTQNLITMSPVPLPAASLLMLSALGLGGIVTRRRAATKT